MVVFILGTGNFGLCHGEFVQEPDNTGDLKRKARWKNNTFFTALWVYLSLTLMKLSPVQQSIY